MPPLRSLALQFPSTDDRPEQTEPTARNHSDFAPYVTFTLVSPEPPDATILRLRLPSLSVALITPLAGVVVFTWIFIPRS